LTAKIDNTREVCIPPHSPQAMAVSAWAIGRSESNLVRQSVQKYS